MSGRPVGRISEVVAQAGGAADASPTSEGRRIARNSLLLGAGESVALVFGFATTILVTDHLGDRYGLWLGVQRARMAPLLREAVPFVAIGLAFTTLRSFEVVILTRFASVAETSLYGAARNFVARYGAAGAAIFERRILREVLARWWRA